MRLLAGFFAVLLSAAVAEREAFAQNVDPYFFGDEAALAAGAVTASVRDSGSLWYNPAGFGGLNRGLVSASASTFGIRVRRIPDALRFHVGGEDQGVSVSSVDVLSVPNAVVAATRVGDRFAIAGGLLTTSRDVRSALAVSPERPGMLQGMIPITSSQRLDLQTDSAKYHFGGAFAAALSEQFRLGAALFVTYAKTTQSVQYALSAKTGPNPTDEHAFFIETARVTKSAVGFAGSVGTQWEPSSRVALGLTIRSPEIAITSSTEGGAVLGTASVGGTDPAQASLVDQSPPPRDSTGEVVGPARALAGVAISLGAPASWLELGADAAHGLPSTSIGDAQLVTVNGRLGFRYMLAPEWVIGGGVFSDRATKRRVGELIGTDKVDYYGLTFGVSKRTPLALVQDPKPEALILVTTLSLRAAVGFGQARAFVLDFDRPEIPRDDLVDVTFYEVMPYLGSSVIF